MTVPSVSATSSSGPSHTEAEILSQPAVWTGVIDSVDPHPVAKELKHAAEVVVIGCGSTHYLAMTATALLRDVGVRAWALPSSELLTGAQHQIREPHATVLLAFSRSGTTTETTRAVEHCRRMGVQRVVAVTCDPASTLATQADLVLATPGAQEQSVAQTRSFSSMTVALSAVVGAVAQVDLRHLRALPEAGLQVLQTSRERMRTIARADRLEAFYFLGSGPLFGIASEGMLKLKEMSLTHSEAYHAMEFRHGPMSMCGDDAAVVALVTPERRALEDGVVRDLSSLGSGVTTVGPGCDADLPPLPPWLRPALYLLPLQLLALERSLGKGLNPDQPRHLTAVIHLEDT